MSENIILWDNGKSNDFVNTMQNLNQEFSVIYNYEEFINLDWSGVKNILILGELNWQNKTGFDIIKKIRNEKKMKMPISVFSEKPKNTWIETNNLSGSGNILLAPGHIFYQINENFDLEKIEFHNEPLDADLLDDIRYSFYNPKGKIQNEIHILKNKLMSLIEDYDIENAIENTFSTIEKELEKEKKKLKLGEIKRSIVEKIKEKDKSQHPSSIVVEFSEQIYALYPTAIDEVGDTSPKEKPDWEVLFIDDELHHREKVKEYFKANGIICHTVANNKDLITKLEEEKKISAIIADMRLLTPTGEWQSKQGYQVLKDLHQNKANSSNAFAFFALTSKKGTILNQLKQSSNFITRWYSKEDTLLSLETFKIFCDQVEIAAVEAHKKNISQPSTSSWVNGLKGRFDKPLETYYKVHLEMHDYCESEAYMNKQAETLGNKLVNDENIENIKIMITIKDITHEERMLKFRSSILFGRRLVFYLLLKLNKKHPNYTIKNLKSHITDFFTSEENEKPDKTIRLLFNTTLCIKEKDIQAVIGKKGLEEGELLVEEKQFLRQLMSENVEHIEVDREDIKKIFNCLLLIGEPSFLASFTREQTNGKIDMHYLDELFSYVSRTVSRFEGEIKLRIVQIVNNSLNARTLSNLEIIRRLNIQ